MISQHKTFMTTKEVARYLSMSTSLLEKLRCKKEGAPYYKPTGKVLYKKSDVDAWLESNRMSGGQANV